MASLTPLPVRKPSLLQVGSAPDVSTVRETATKKIATALAAQEPLSLPPVTAVILGLFVAAVASRTMTE